MYTVVHKNVPLLFFEYLHAALGDFNIFGVQHQEET